MEKEGKVGGHGAGRARLHEPEMHVSDIIPLALVSGRFRIARLGRLEALKCAKKIRWGNRKCGMGSVLASMMPYLGRFSLYRYCLMMKLKKSP